MTTDPPAETVTGPYVPAGRNELISQLNLSVPDRAVTRRSWLSRIPRLLRPRPTTTGRD